MKKIKINKGDLVKIVSITGTVLSLAGTFLSGWSNDQKMESSINKKIAESLQKQNGKS